MDDEQGPGPLVPPPERDDHRSERTRVTISIRDDYTDRFDEVVAAATAAGLEIEESLDLIGVVCGSIAAARVPDLDRVPGVAFVERSRTYQLPPPVSDLQ